MALVDVDEQYERKRVRKSAPLIDTKLASEFAQMKCKEADKFFSSNEVEKKPETIDRKSRISSSTKELASRTEIIGAAVTRIEKVKRKTELCKRHVPQLLIRGEHVVSIVLL